MQRGAAVFLLCLLQLAQVARGFLPPQNPRWAPTYNMQRSTLCMIANFAGMTNASFAGAFGVVSYDWSNDKANWVLARPMDCEEAMLRQAIATKRHSPETRVFVYRNLVKALPWFSSVRRKLDDDRYSGFFLRFKPKGPYHVPPCTTQTISPSARPCITIRSRRPRSHHRCTPARTERAMPRVTAADTHAASTSSITATGRS